MMTDNMTRYLTAITNSSWAWAFRKLFEPLYDRQTSRMLSSAGLVIHGSASALAKTGSSACYAVANGVPLRIAASTDMPALVGTVTNATFNAYCFFIDSGGTVTSQMGTGGATWAAVQLPQVPKWKAFIGFIRINPTGTGDFVGGTTALDDGTVVPNAEYVSLVAGFDPYALIGGN